MSSSREARCLQLQNLLRVELVDFVVGLEELVDLVEVLVDLGEE